MPGFEVIVRPVVMPGIRPAPRASVLPAETDPEEGFAIIRGSSAKTIDLPYSYSLTWSVAVPTETEREVDVARVYQKEDGGGEEAATLMRIGTRTVGDAGINRDNYVDIEVARRIRMSEPGGEVDYHYAPVQASDNVEILATNLVRRR